jgi:GGDEF domain-containing protein
MLPSAANCDDVRDIAVECFRAAVRNVAFYAIELDKEVTAAFRTALSRLESRAETIDKDALPALLRDYRGRAVAYANRLSSEVEEVAGKLRHILDSLSAGDCDFESRMRNALARLRSLASSADAAGLHDPLLAAAASIQLGLDEIHGSQQEMVERLLEEIRTLHKSIDSLESAVAVDMLSSLLTRGELTKRFQSPARAPALVLLLTAAGLRLAETRFDGHVATQLAAAFLKRLNRVLPIESTIGRWSEEQFMVLLPATEADTVPAEKLIEEQLSGAYACTQNGKTVRPTLQVRAGMLTAAEATALAEGP